MNPRIVIVDYGMGNLRNVQRGFEKVGFEARVTRSKREIEKASGIVLPGVGAFKDCMVNLDRYGLVEIMLESIKKGKPYLGICLGLQILFSESEEFGLHKGLDVVRGKVVKFKPHPEYKVPHMGWNTVEMNKEVPLLKGVKDGDFFYFVHSYYVVPEDKEWVGTSTQYGTPFASSIWKGNIFATQFHPEKSQTVGLQLLKNFVALAS
jgi:glutamine amidotransferase